MTTVDAPVVSHLIGVDGGGTGTRVRLARADGTVLSQGHAGPSGLAHGVPAAWAAIDQAITQAFQAALLVRPPNHEVAIGLGLAGVNNPQWAGTLLALQPGYASIVLETDAFTTLLGAHGGEAGAIVAVGTGSVGMALWPDGRRCEVGGWGFPAGDEGSGGWLGLRAMGHLQHVLDGRAPAGPLSQALLGSCGGGRETVIAWSVAANQTRFASLAPLVIAHAGIDPVAQALLVEGGRRLGEIAQALDPEARLPMALCGGLSGPLRKHLPAELSLRAVAPQGDSASGALYLIHQQLQGRTVLGSRASPAIRQRRQGDASWASVRAGQTAATNPLRPGDGSATGTLP